MSRILGWPSDDYAPLCGGASEYYWTSTAGKYAGTYGAISINVGFADEQTRQAAKLYVMCVP